MRPSLRFHDEKSPESSESPRFERRAPRRRSGSSAPCFSAPPPSRAAPRRAPLPTAPPRFAKARPGSPCPTSRTSAFPFSATSEESPRSSPPPARSRSARARARRRRVGGARERRRPSSRRRPAWSASRSASGRAANRSAPGPAARSRARARRKPRAPGPGARTIERSRRPSPRARSTRGRGTQPPCGSRGQPVPQLLHLPAVRGAHREARVELEHHARELVRAFGGRQARVKRVPQVGASGRRQCARRRRAF